jgi:hypothetical protein
VQAIQLAPIHSAATSSLRAAECSLASSMRVEEPFQGRISSRRTFPSLEDPCHLKGIYCGFEGTVALIARCICESVQLR